MKYKINPDELDTSFRVPTSIVDNHIRLANEHQLKVLLWILRNSPNNPDVEQMCADLKIKPDDASDYLQYWVLTGVITASGEKAQAPSKPSAAAAVEPKQPAPAFIPPAKPPINERARPTSIEISARISESPEIGNLFREAQLKLGKTIGYDGQCTLLMMHDYDGLPVEVIYMLLDYCVSIKKTHSNYIAAIGRDWGEKEIDSIEKAAEKISALRSADSVWSDFAAMAGITNPRPTAAQTNYLAHWSRDFGFSSDMIYLAYEEMANHTHKLSFSYMDKVLTTWHESGFKHPADVAAAKAAKSAALKADKPAPQKQKPGSLTNKASYDIDAFTKKALSGNLRYERKKSQ